MTGSGRNWFEFYLLVLTLAWAIFSWVIGDGEVVAMLFTQVGRHIWFAGLIVSSALALVGIITGTVTGLLLERAALYFLAGLLGWVGVAFLSFAAKINALHLVYVTPLLLIAAAVMLSRTWQIRRDLNRIRQHLAAMSSIPGPGAA
jgi:hypothetical protein